MENIANKKRNIQIIFVILMISILLLLIKSCSYKTKNADNLEDKYKIIGNFKISYGKMLDRDELKVIHNEKEVMTTIDDSKVNYEKLGTYIITIIYIDENGKERRTEKEIEIIDDKAPLILLNGSKNIKIGENTEYKELGYEIIDNYDNKKDIKVNIKGIVNTNKPGTYVITYVAIDRSGNKSEVRRTVIVEAKETNLPTEEKPVGVTLLQLNGTSTVYIDYPNSYTEIGATAIDTVDKDISKNIKVSGSVDTNKLGTYTITYEITNSSNITTQTARTVIVRDREKPIITLVGDSDITLEIKSPYIEQGAVVSDNYDTNLTYTIHGLLDTDTVGVYTLTYQVKDSSSNITSVNRTIRIVETKYLVLFNSGGSYVAPQEIAKGEFIYSPTSPTRSGYTFSYWYEEGASDSTPFDFVNTVIEKNTILIAKWNSKIVNYKVDIWLEIPNFQGTPTPGNMDEYNYVTSINLSATAGTQTNLDINSMPSSIANLFTGTTSILKYATPQYVENKEILGNGNTVISLYAARKEYTYEFYLGTDKNKTMTTQASTYIGGTTSTRYSINVKYESDISYSFPLGIAVFSTGFASWGRPSSLTWKDTSNIASIRKVVDEGMLSQDGKTLTYTFTANWNASGTVYEYRYFAEILPEQDVYGLAVINYNGKDYVLMEEYNQKYQGNLNAKSINGLTVVNSSPVTYNYNASTKTYTAGTGTAAHRCFFYNRNVYTLSFNMMQPVGGTVTPIANQSILFGEKLTNYKPTPNPSILSGNYRFAGWYRDITYKVEFDFYKMTMPDSNITAYAKWESTDNKVTFLDEKGGNEVGSQGVASGAYVIDNTDQYLKLDSNNFSEEKGEFIGWYYEISGYEFKWTFETNVYTNYTLYAAWKTSSTP